MVKIQLWSSQCFMIHIRKLRFLQYHQNSSKPEPCDLLIVEFSRDPSIYHLQTVFRLVVRHHMASVKYSQISEMLAVLHSTG